MPWRTPLLRAFAAGQVQSATARWAPLLSLAVPCFVPQACPKRGPPPLQLGLGLASIWDAHQATTLEPVEPGVHVGVVDVLESQTTLAGDAERVSPPLVMMFHCR